MQVKDLLKDGQTILANSPTANLDCRLLLAHLLECEATNLLVNQEQTLNSIIINKFWQLIERRAQYEPVAYIIGKKEFYGLEFIVNKNTLIPRPETELLIDLAKKILAKIDRNINYHLLELGTGSGAIAVTLAKEIKGSLITAIDNSSAALEIAQANLAKHQVARQVSLVTSDWFTALPIFEYDLIISNPPYICQTSEKADIIAETRLFEPANALYAAEQGLANYRLIIQQAAIFLQKNAYILLEIGYKQANYVAKLLKINHFVDIEIVKDLAGLDRVIMARMAN